VSALSSSDAWAVGGVVTVPGGATTFHWNGTAWSQVSTPALSVFGTLDAVSGASPNDAWAAGSTMPARRVHLALYEHWDGTAWSIVPGPGATVTGLAAVSATNVWAVGSNGLVANWNGATWNAVTVPLPTSSASLSGVTATSASNVWAVGSNGASPFALHFDGTSWTLSNLATPSGVSNPVINAVSATSPNDVWAVGENGATTAATVIEHWNGTAWSIVPSPTPNAASFALDAVAARNSTDAVAAGWFIPANGGPQQGYILRWNGTSWSTDTDPSGATFSPIYGAATATGAPEWAVGVARSGTIGSQALVLSHP
jgi:hypothetical protein